MSLNKYAAIRYRIIDSAIRSKSRPYPTKERLRQECEEALFGSGDGSHISISTIEKDLWTLRNESTFGYAPIEFDRTRRGYYYSDPEFSINLPLTQEDFQMIRLAMNTLNQFKDSQLFSDLESAVSRIEGRLSLARDWNEDNMGSVIAFESAPDSKGNHLLPVLVDAIRNRHQLTINYLPHVDPVERHYVFDPYLLKEYKNLWYLVGKDRNNNKIRTLGVDRILTFEDTRKVFEPDEEFDPRVWFRFSFGIGTYSGIPEDILLEFDEIQGKYVVNHPLHPTQECLSNSGDRVLIRLRVIRSAELTMQILSYGPRVRVLAPDGLKKEVLSSLTRAISQYDL